MASAARAFEAAERERVAAMSRAMASFAVRQAEFYAGQMKELEGLTQVGRWVGVTSVWCRGVWYS